MKKILLFAAMLLSTTMMYAYFGPVVASSGQKLYYNSIRFLKENGYLVFKTM